MNSRRASGLLVLLLVAGAGLRLWHARANADAHTGGDEGYYEQGVSWLSRGVFSQGPTDARPRVWRGPGFPAFAALVEAPFKIAHPAHLRYAVALLSAAGVCAAYLLAASFAGPLGGLAAAALFAFDPGQIASASSLNIHAFYGLALLMLACAAAAWAEKPEPRRGLLLGAALGFTLLSRSTHLFAVPFILLAGAYPSFKRAAWPVAALVLVMLPWTVRNAALTGRFLPLDAYAGAGNLYAAASGRDEAIDVGDAVALAEAERPGFADAFDKDEAAAFPIMLELGRARIVAAPWSYAKGVARRALALYGSWWPLLIPLGFLLWRKRTRAVWAAAFTLASLAAYPLIAVQSAYADAARPLAAALAGAGLAAEWRHRRAQKGKAWAPDERLARAGAGGFFAAFAATLVLSWGLILGESRVLAASAHPPLRDGRANGLVAAAARRTPRAGGALELGIVLVDQGKTDEACAEFERSWAADEARLEAGARVAHCRLKLGNAKASEKAALKLIVLSHGKGKAHEDRAYSALARALAAQGRAKEAVAAWDRVEKAAEDELSYALALDTAGRKKESHEMLLNMLAALPAAIQEASAKGQNAHARLLSDALVDGSAPKDRARALAERARARLAARDAKGALADFEAAAALAPPSAADALSHGALLREAGKAAAARAIVDAALPLASGSGKAGLLAARASLLWSAGDGEKARADLDAALATDADAACLNAPALAEPGSMPSSYFDACLARFPGRSRLLSDRGVALWREGRKDDARNSLREAVSADPKDLSAALSFATAAGSSAESKDILRAALAGSSEAPDSLIRKRAKELLK